MTELLQEAQPLLAELGSLGEEWHVTGPNLHPGLIRTVEHDTCPLVELGRARGVCYLTNDTDVEILADAAEIDVALAGAMVDAADATEAENPEGGQAFIYSVELRDALLDAVGLGIS